MMPSRLTDRDDWVEIFIADKRSMLETMRENLSADLSAGYAENSKAVINQRVTIAEYSAKFNAEMELFKYMDEKTANRWAFYDLKKRGAIL